MVGQMDSCQKVLCSVGFNLFHVCQLEDKEGREGNVHLVVKAIFDKEKKHVGLTQLARYM